MPSLISEMGKGLRIVAGESGPAFGSLPSATVRNIDFHQSAPLGLLQSGAFYISAVVLVGLAQLAHEENVPRPERCACCEYRYHADLETQHSDHGGDR
jgi:hypothetical protein